MKKPQPIENLQTMSDVEVLNLSLAKPRVFEELVSRYQRLFLRKAKSILRNEEDAYDVVQDTFVRICVAARKFKAQEGASFSSWAYTILVNQCYSAYKKREKHAVISLDLEPELAEVIPDRAAIEEIENKFTREYVLRLISKLPVLMKRVVELHFLEGLSQRDVAKREGVSEGVIRSRVHRAKKEMQKMDLQFAYVAAANQSKPITR